MKKMLAILKNVFISFLFLLASFVICLWLHGKMRTTYLIPSVYILGCFLTSVLTDGYFYGISAAVISVLAVNYAFTFPFFKINFTIPENFFSALIMITISTVTCFITTRLKTREKERAESAREHITVSLLRALSHDLRTPLTTIYGAGTAILENGDYLTEEQKETMLIGIRQDSQRLAHMVDNLLSVTKLESDDAKIFKAPTSLDELVDSVLVKLRLRYPEWEVNVELPDELMIIPMDAVLIERVLMNILDNAVLHAKGMTALSLKVYKKGDKAVFEIKDNGCGVDSEKMKNLFKAGFSSPVSDGRSHNIGIGLLVCSTIIKAHGGEIEAENLKSGGALFQFTLNLEESENE